MTNPEGAPKNSENGPREPKNNAGIIAKLILMLEQFEDKNVPIDDDSKKTKKKAESSLWARKISDDNERKTQPKKSSDKPSRGRSKFKKDEYFVKPETVEQINQTFNSAISSAREAGNLPTTVEAGGHKQTVAEQFKTLREVIKTKFEDDKNILYHETIKVYLAVEWLDLDNNEARQLRASIDEALKEVSAARGRHETPDQLIHDVDKRPDIYRSHRPAEPQNETPLTKKLNRDLRALQDTLDDTSTTLAADEQKALVYAEGQLKSLYDYATLHPTVEDDKEMVAFIKESQERVSKLNPPKIEKPVKVKEQPPINNQDRKGSYQQEPVPLDEDWIYKDETGKFIAGENKIPEDESLAAVLGGIVEMDIQNEDSMEVVYKKFLKLEEEYKSNFAEKLHNINSSTNTLTEAEKRQLIELAQTELQKKVDAVQEYQNNFIRVYASKNPGRVDRFQKERNEDLLDPKKRDKIFYEKLQKLLQAPNQSSRDALTLNEETEFSMFIQQVRSGVPEGVKIAEYYLLRKEAITQFHDADFLAGSANPDLVKAWVGMLGYMRDTYIVDAIKDPLVEEYLHALEEALDSIMQNNDGYIPPDLVGFNVDLSENHWEELAKEIVRKNVISGKVRDYKKDPKTGLRDQNAKPGELGEVLTVEDLDDMELRLVASLRMAKGFGMVNMHLLKKFAFSKIPMIKGVDTEKQLSSIPYEGLAQKMNWAGWMLRFRVADQYHHPFFLAAIGVDGNEILNYIKFNPNKWKEIMDATQAGTLDEYLQKEYKSKNKKVPKMIATMIDELKFLGRLDVDSGWAATEATIGMDEKELEKIGTSLRLARATGWATEKVKQSWLEKKLGKDWMLGKSDVAIKSIIGSYDREWNFAKHEKHLHEEIEDYEKKYRLYVWMQAVLRNPLGVAQQIELPKEEGYDAKISLRNILLKEILNIDVVNDVASESTTHPSSYQRAYMNRINILVTDLAVVKRMAMTGGENGGPRNISASDFDVIASDNKFEIWVNGKGEQEVITPQIRRDQARDFWIKMQERVLGTSTYEESIKLMSDLGYDLVLDNKTPKTEKERSAKANGVVRHELIFDTKSNILDSLKECYKAIKLEKNLNSEPTPLIYKLLDKKPGAKSGLDDVVWSSLDISTIGGRSWMRRGNDLMVRSETQNLVGNLLKQLKGEPDFKTITKILKEISENESNYDPAAAKKISYMMIRGIAHLYGQKFYGPIANIPFVGRALRKTRLTPLSIAQMIYGVKHAKSLNANELKEFIDHAANETNLPHDHIGINGEHYEWNTHQLLKDANATERIAMAEFALLASAGVFGGLLAMAIIWGFKNSDDNKKHH